MSLIPIPALFAAVPLVMFGALLVKGIAIAQNEASPSNDLLEDNDSMDSCPCPTEFVARVFSPEDATFISGTKCEQLVRLFRSERKAVAQLWVRQISTAIQRTMRDHSRIARASHDLEFVTEVKLFLIYGELISICGFLFVAIQCVGPLWFGRVASYVDAHSQRLAGIQQSFHAAISPREFPRVGAA